MLDYDLVPGLDGVGVGGAGQGVPALPGYLLSHVLGDLCVGHDLPRF